MLKPKFLNPELDLEADDPKRSDHSNQARRAENSEHANGRVGRTVQAGIGHVVHNEGNPPLLALQICGFGVQGLGFIVPCK